MYNVALYTILSVLVVSMVSLLGLLTISLHQKFGKKILTLLVSFSAGALLGDVFIHILPELAEEGKFNLTTSLYILLAIAGFFVLENFLHWHHDHGDENPQGAHPVAYLNLVGDALHNIIDGMIIAGAYLLDIQLGIATTVAVMLHEIPQEIGDFGVLVYGGFSKIRALFYNLLSALTALVGAVIVLVANPTEQVATILAALGAGSFIYIATADLIPQIHKEKERKVSHFFAFLFGIAILLVLLLNE